MGLRISDRMLWLSFGFLAYFGIRYIGSALADNAQLNQSRDDPKAPRVLDAAALAEAEDRIPLSSLYHLTLSSNIDIRSSALKILCSRVLRNPDALISIGQDLISENEDRRSRALLAASVFGRQAILNAAAEAGPPTRDSAQENEE